MSQASAADFQKVTDPELLRAIERADSRTYGGQPDSHTVADECELSAPTIQKRARDLESRGHLESSESVVLGGGQWCTTYDVTTDPDSVDADAVSVSVGGARTEYTDDELLHALRFVDKHVDEPLTTGVYEHHRHDGHPSVVTIRERFGGWEEAKDMARNEGGGESRGE